MTRVLADDTENSLALDNATVSAKTFHGWPYFHCKKIVSVIFGLSHETLSYPVILTPCAAFWREDGMCTTDFGSRNR